MKKFILPFIIIFTSLTSCTSSSEQYDIFNDHIQLYEMVAAQNEIVLDPFWIAYRLDRYIASGYSTDIKKKLFRHAEIKSEEGASDHAYLIEYAFSDEPLSGDCNRFGIIRIATHGQTLSQEGAVWLISTPEKNSKPYLMDNEYYGRVQENIDYETYRIESLGENRWNVTGDKIWNGIFSSSLYFSPSWSIDIIIEQVSTDGNENLQFQLTSKENGLNGGYTYYGQTIRYNILEPVLYDSACTYLKKSGGVEEVVVMDSQYAYFGTDTVTVNRGREFRCHDNFSVTAKDMNGEYKTRYF